MTNTVRLFPRSRLAFILSVLASSSAWAGLDAGAQIRRYQDETVQRLQPAKPQADSIEGSRQPVSKAAAASAEKIHVAAFAVRGVTRLTDDEVANVLKPFVGRELDTAGIHAAADALNRLYRDRGYFVAKVFIPPQEVAETIGLDVYEGYLDTPGIEVVNKGKRVDAKVVQGILDTHLPAGSPIHRADYERALLIAEDLPGVTTSSTLYPGAQVGTARLRTTMTDLPLLSGNVDIDNFGSKATGQVRLGTTLYLNSPSGLGDQVVGRFVTSGERSNYGYLTYLLPVSSWGTRLGASIDYFSYNADYTTNLGYSDGHASDLRLYLTHPIVRSRHGNLNFRADLSQLSIDDRNDLQVNADRKINTATLALHGDDDHPWLMTGLTVFNLSATFGTVNVQGNTAYVNVDRTTAQTDGAFSRVNFSASRLTRLTQNWSFMTKLNGQWGSGNLDSSQRFYLGGGSSLSGYPLGEARGDSGAEYSLELRHDFAVPWSGTLTGGIFLQEGWVRTHRSPWTGWQGSNPLIENEFKLSSAGFSVLSTIAGNWVVRGLVGWQLGSNPMRDPATGRASDNRGNDYRAWFQVIRYF
jgi:hemolysin activation/secretion protein